MEFSNKTSRLVFVVTGLFFSWRVLTAFTLPFLSPSTFGVEWLTPVDHDFGDIIQGKPAGHAFRFRNSGDEPLVIDNVRTSCGCTAPDWPKTPILPDSTAAIDIEFSARQQGYFYKKIKVYFRGQRRAEQLTIEGYVE